MVSKFEIKKLNIPVGGATKPENTTGGVVLNIGGSLSGSQSIDGTSIYSSLRSVADLINTYRKMTLIPEVDFAVSEITNEAIIVDGDNKVVDVDVDSEVDANITKDIIEAWDRVYSRVRIHYKVYDWFLRWYVDSRLYFEKIRDTRGRVKALRYIDPRKIIKIRLYSTEEKEEQYGSVIDDDGNKLYIVDEFFFYVDKAVKNFTDGIGSVRYISNEDFYSKYDNSGTRIDPKDIIYIHSGLVDSSTGVVYGYLHKAIKAANMLSQLEDFAMVHKLSRAQSKLAFYVDVGNLPVEKAMEHLRQQATKYKNHYEYDPETGKVINSKHTIPVVEDFWFLRFGGSRGTEVQTISGDESGAVTTEEIQLFREKLMMALNVPISRFSTDTASVVLGTHEEITREELKFANFIRRLRSIFVKIFDGLLREELIATGVVNESGYEKYKKHIFWKWAENSYYEEVKKLNIISKKVGVANEVAGLGFYPEKWIMQEVMGHSQEEIYEIEKMKKEQGPEEETGGGEFPEIGGEEAIGGEEGEPEGEN